MNEVKKRAYKPKNTWRGMHVYSHKSSAHRFGKRHSKLGVTDLYHIFCIAGKYIVPTTQSNYDLCMSLGLKGETFYTFNAVNDEGALDNDKP